MRGLVFGHQAIDDHLLLQRVLSTEAELFLADFHPVMPVMAELLRAEALRLLADEQLRPGIDAEEAAGYVTGSSCPTSAVRASGTSPTSGRCDGWSAPSSWPGSSPTPERT